MQVDSLHVTETGYVPGLPQHLKYMPTLLLPSTWHFRYSQTSPVTKQ